METYDAVRASSAAADQVRREADQQAAIAVIDRAAARDGWTAEDHDQVLAMLGLDGTVVEPARCSECRTELGETDRLRSQGRCTPCQRAERRQRRKTASDRL